MCPIVFRSRPLRLASLVNADASSIRIDVLRDLALGWFAEHRSVALLAVLVVLRFWLSAIEGNDLIQVHINRMKY